MRLPESGRHGDTADDRTPADAGLGGAATARTNGPIAGPCSATSSSPDGIGWLPALEDLAPARSVLGEIERDGEPGGDGPAPEA